MATKRAKALFSRNSGRGLRVSVKPGAFEPNEEHRELLQKVMQGEADAKERKRFQELHFQRSCDLVEMPDDQMFRLEEVQEELPAKARIEPSETCSRCGEQAMRSKLEKVDGQSLCRACLCKSWQIQLVGYPHLRGFFTFRAASLTQTEVVRKLPLAE